MQAIRIKGRGGKGIKSSSIDEDDSASPGVHSRSEDPAFCSAFESSDDELVDWTIGGKYLSTLNTDERADWPYSNSDPAFEDTGG